jgi:hypothetical protein
MNRKSNDKKNNSKSSNIKSDGYRSKRSIKSILDKKVKKGYNISWRVRDKDGNILGYISGYNSEGFILNIDRDLPNASEINIVIGHPFIKEEFHLTIKITWRHKINEFLDETGVLIKKKPEEWESLLENLSMFYPQQLETIGRL